MPIVSSRASSEAGWKSNFLILYSMIAEALVFISVGVIMHSMCRGPADIGIYIVQTDGQSWPFIVRFGWGRETRSIRFWFFRPMHGLYLLTSDVYPIFTRYPKSGFLLVQTGFVCYPVPTWFVWQKHGWFPKPTRFVVKGWEDTRNLPGFWIASPRIPGTYPDSGWESGYDWTG